MVELANKEFLIFKDIKEKRNRMRRWVKVIKQNLMEFLKLKYSILKV